MTDEKVVEANSLLTIDRGTSSRSKMSRKRFLAFTMAGLMIVAAVSMIAPSILGNNDQNNGNDQIAGTSWDVPQYHREAIYKVDHLFESYMKAQNWTKAAHNGKNGLGIGTLEVFLGHHNQTVMGVNEWLNMSAGASPRSGGYAEMTLRNNYPYIFYWNPNPTGKSAPTLPCGLETWAPYRLTAVVKNDTALRTGTSAATRNVPFCPQYNRTGGGSGGYINVSLYGSYMSANEVAALRANVHFGNWFYGMPTTVTPLKSANDGYFFELHGTYQFSNLALQTFLNWTPGLNGDSANATTWFNAEKGVGGMPAGSSTITSAWRTWLWNNYSQAGTQGSGQPYWNNTPNNGNIYTIYEFDMAGSLGLYVSMKLDPLKVNGTTDRTLAIRVYMMGWGPDSALIRMVEAANITGSLGHTGYGNWTNRAPMVNYAEDVYLNTSISPRMANSSMREVITYSMIGWEDSSTQTWSGGYQIPLGSHADYIANDFGAPQTSYMSPFNKYALGGRIDVASGDNTKSYNWRGAGSIIFGTNASVCLVTPQVRNLTAYEAIIVDLKILSSPWNAARNARFGGQAMAMLPHVGTSMAPIGAAKTLELNNLLYWGTAKLGKGSYPQAAILAGYNGTTKILNLSGGTTGMAMPIVYNTDYWGGDAGQSVVYTKSMPSIQVDISAVNHYDVQMQSGPYYPGTNYWVHITPHNASTTAYPGGTIPEVMGGVAARTAVAPYSVLVNETVKLSVANNAGTTYPGNGSSIIVTNASAWTTVRFGNPSSNIYLNATGQWFNYTEIGVNEATRGSASWVTVLLPTHAPIVINGNAGFTVANGVSAGDGSAGNPYIIAYWNISASTANGITIENTNAHFIVENCYIYDGGLNYYGIYLNNCTNGVLSSNTLIGGGMVIDSPSISGWNTHSIDTSNTVNGNPVYYYKNQSGITVPAGAGQVILANCTGFVIENQNLNDSGIGIEIGYSSGITVANNTCSNNTYGIYLFASSSGNILSNNNCSSNTQYGIILVSSSSNDLLNNTCISNNVVGIYIYSSSNNNNLSDNDCSGSVGGFYIRSSNDNTLTNNNCSSNTWYGMHLVSSSSNNLLNNTCSLNTLYGIYLTSSSGNTLNNNTCNLNKYGMYLVSSSSNDLLNNTCSSNTQYGIFLVSSSSNDLLNNTCISNNVVGIYIYSSSNNNNLSDNDCSGSLEGFYIRSSNDNTLTNNNCSSNTWYGMYLLTSSGNMLTNNNCSSNNIVGIYLYASSNNNNLSDNDCSGSRYGFYIRSSNGNTLSNNTCNSNTWYGMCLVSSSSNNLLNNTCSLNTLYGIYLTSSSGNTLNNNTCNLNKYGMYLVSSSSNDLLNNTCSSNTQYGIFLVSSSSNDLLNNTCISNNVVGIYIYSSSNNNNLSDNNCSDNGMDGFYIRSSNDNTLTNNNCSSNTWYGMYLLTSSGNEITQNKICNNLLYGVRLSSDSSTNLICNNTFIGNNGAGSVRNPLHLQAYDAGTGNHWNVTGYGNYWSDWTTPDENHNGIVDSAYILPGGVVKDMCPLVNPPI